MMRVYIGLVAEGCQEAGVGVLATCLMTNHVHLVLVPTTADGVTRALSSAHQRTTWVFRAIALPLRVSPVVNGGRFP